jgi:uncharacterized protein (TIGR03435 family)
MRIATDRVERWRFANRWRASPILVYPTAGILIAMATLARRTPGRAAAPIAAAALVLLAAHAAFSQPAYRYDVVSIKRADPDQQNSGFSNGPQGGMRARNVTPLMTLAFSYNVQDYQILELPAWARSERYEITFTPDKTEVSVDGENVPRSALDGWLSRQRQRMQAVLHDRFNVALHQETRELPSYILTVAKGGPKLHRAAQPDRGQNMNINNGRQLICTSTPMKSLAEGLAMVLGHPVRDETGLDGAFDFQMEWAPESTARMSEPGAATADSDRPSIFTALTEKLGLRLDSKKAPVTVYVVDKIDHPSDN